MSQRTKLVYGGETHQNCSLPRPTPPTVLRVIQNPFGKVIFVKKAPWNHSLHQTKNLNGQITVLSIFRLFYFFQRTKFSSTDIFFQNVFWQNSRQEHNLKLTPQGFCITRHIDGVVAFGAIPIWWFSGHLTQIPTQDFVVLTGEIFLGGFWATGGPWSAKSDQFWVDIFKPKWNLSYIDGARLRDSEPDACLFPLYPGVTCNNTPKLQGRRRVFKK